jgi:hypothetical protein
MGAETGAGRTQKEGNMASVAHSELERMVTPEKRRRRRSRLDGRVLEYVLHNNARLDQPQDAAGIARALAAPYSTVTAAIRRLERAGCLVPTLVVNNFLTRYCHEYLVAIAIDGRAITKGDAERRERLAKLPGSAAHRDGGPVECFVEELFHSLESSRDYRDHLVACDAVLLHGAPDRDFELDILTDDGSYSLGRWIRNELTGNPCIRAMHTTTVGFRFSRNGYSGQHANNQQAGNGLTAEK